MESVTIAFFLLLLAGSLFAIYVTASALGLQASLDHRANARYFPKALYAGYPEDIREMARIADVELDSCLWGHSDDPDALRACDRGSFATFAVMKRGWCPRWPHNYSPIAWRKCPADERIPPSSQFTPEYTDARIAAIIAQRKADGSHARFVEPIALSEIRSPPRPGVAPATPARAMEILKAQRFSQPLDRNPTLRRLGRVRDTRHSFDFYLLKQDGYYGHRGEALVVLLAGEKYVGHYPVMSTEECTMKDFSIACGPEYEHGRAVLNYRHGRLPGQMFGLEDIDLVR